MTTTHRPDAFAVTPRTSETHTTTICLIGRDDRVTASVGRRLARLLGSEFVEGRLLHPAGRERASDGAPRDHDRLNWLSEIGRTIARSSTGVVVVCPPISRSSRDIVRWEASATRFIRLAQAGDEPSSDLVDIRFVPEESRDAIVDRIAKLLATTRIVELMPPNAALPS